MPKKKEKDGVEYYKGKFREADKEVRNLRKRLKQLERSKHIYESFIEEPKLEIEEDKPRKCPECAKGDLEEFDIVGRIFERCKICEYRKKIK